MKQQVLRKEVVSGLMFPTNQLIRIVKTKTGEIFLDQGKKANGRGVYIAPNLVAINQAQQKKLLERSLKTKNLGELYQQLLNEVQQNWD